MIHADRLITSNRRKRHVRVFWSLQLDAFDHMIARDKIEGYHVKKLLANFEVIGGKVDDLYDEVFFIKYLERIYNLQRYAEEALGSATESDRAVVKNIRGELGRLVSGV